METARGSTEQRSTHAKFSSVDGFKAISMRNRKPIPCKNAHPKFYYPQLERNLSFISDWRFGRTEVEEYWGKGRRGNRFSKSPKDGSRSWRSVPSPLALQRVAARGKEKEGRNGRRKVGRQLVCFQMNPSRDFFFFRANKPSSLGCKQETCISTRSLPGPPSHRATAANGPKSQNFLSSDALARSTPRYGPTLISITLRWTDPTQHF